MKTLSFELTMPNVGSWNGKWSGADKKYYIIKTISDKYFNKTLIPLLGEQNHYWYYNFGDGWGAGVQMQIITSSEAKVRRKNSKGFSGYDWMVDSIMRFGEILTESQRKERIKETSNI
jgi:hypothetical protein